MRKHEGVRYPCSQRNNLQNAKISLKDAQRVCMRYPCNQCEYSATQEGHLERRIQSIHEGVRYP